MAYMDTGLKKITFIYDWLAVKMNRCLQETYPNEWQKERPSWSELTPTKEPPLTTTDP